MRKHGRRGTLTSISSRFWIRKEGQDQERRRTSLNFESNRQTCSWKTDSGRTRIIKH